MPEGPQVDEKSRFNRNCNVLIEMTRRVDCAKARYFEGWAIRRDEHSCDASCKFVLRRGSRCHVFFQAECQLTSQ